MASVFYWVARDRWVYKWDEDGRDRRRTFKTEADARKFKRSMEGGISPGQAPTLGQLSILYGQAVSLHPQTARDVSRYLTTACATFLDKPADTINRQDLLIMRDVMTAGPATKNKAQAYITAILNWGVENELIHLNPWAGAKKLKAPKREMTATLEDFQAILSHAAPHVVWSFDVALSLALRPGEVELFRLKWSAFDWAGRLVRVKQGKTGRVKTVFPPEPFLGRAWDRYQQDKKNGISHVITFAGRPIQSIKVAWQAAKKRAGLENKDIRPYDIRHLAATHMLAAGADIAAVSAQLGHASISTTVSTYAHVLGDAQRRAATSLPQLKIDDKPA